METTNAFASNVRQILQKGGCYPTLASDKIALAGELAIASKRAHNEAAEDMAGEVLRAAAHCQTTAAAEYLTTPQTSGRVYLAAAFSLQMVVSTTAVIATTVIFPEQIPQNVESRIGRPEVAAVLSDLLGRPIPYDRTPVHLRNGDTLYLVQLSGNQLPKDATTLPPGVQLHFRKVMIHS